MYTCLHENNNIVFKKGSLLNLLIYPCMQCNSIYIASVSIKAAVPVQQAFDV